MCNRGSFALALHCDWWSNMVSLIVPCPIPLDRPALKDVKPCCPEEPQDHVDHVGPPGDAQPLLVDQKQAAVEEKERELDEGESGAHEHHTQPDMLQDRICQSCHHDPSMESELTNLEDVRDIPGHMWILGIDPP